MFTAKLAYNVARRHGATTYLARLRLYGRLGHVGAYLGMGDTREEAERDAVRYARESLQRDGLPMPEPENIGKLPRVKFDCENFQ